jgi:hypothetical protein
MKPTLVLVAMVAAILTFSACYYSRPSPFIPAGWILKDTGATPVPISRTELVAGGKCVAKLTYNKEGELTKVETDTKGCFVGQKSLLVNKEPLLHNSDSITFGKGTTTCYGPPFPDPAMCVCTEEPCPW